MELEAGQTIERFTVEAKLGEGGMAAVYRVRHNTLGSHHALKLLKSSNADVRRRLVEEGRVQAALHHPNIVAVTDVLVVDGQPGLLMELVNGPTLEQWLWENRPTLEQAEALFRGIVAGVGRAHRSGLVHRDLKPGNVLLDVADGVVIPKVTDFGLAKILADEQGGHSQTRSGVTLGTPQFMAPEQIRNAKGVDQRADIFALGCILYNLVCGRPPFQDPDILNLYNAIANGQYAPPETYAPGLPARISQAITGALVVDREQRTQDCDALRIATFGPDELQTGSSARMWQGVQPEAPRAPMKLQQGATRLPAGSMNKAASTMGLPPPAPPPPATNTGRTILALAALALGLGVVGLSGVAGAAWWASSGTPSSSPNSAAAELASSEAPVGQTAPVPAPPEPVVAPPPAAVTPPTAAPASVTPSPATPSAAPPTVAPSHPAPAAHADPVHATAAPVAPPATDPKPADVATGHVSVTGAVDRVTLQSGGHSYSPGALKPGKYAVTVQFSGRTAQSIGTLSLAAGQEVVIGCDPTFAMCKIK